MANKCGKSKGRINKRVLVEMLVEFFNRHDGEQVSTKEVFKELDLTSSSARTLCVSILDDLVFDGYLIEPAFRRYQLANSGSSLLGVFKRNKNGYNMFYPEDESEPVIVSERNSGHALTDDYVRVSLFA